MPISDINAIPAIVNEIYRLQPERMIELGIGFGKYGVLCREVLDAMYGRCRPDQWFRKIDGVEAHGAYENPCWKVYNWVDVGNFLGKEIAGYDLVLMVDSLEHLTKNDGEILLGRLILSNKHVIVSVPIGPMPQGETFGNEYE